MEIEQFAKKQGVTVEFTKLAEAREFRETLSLRQAKHAAPPVEAPAVFPTTLFSEESTIGTSVA